MRSTPLTAEARELAARALAEPLPRRWAHVRGVATRAGQVAGQLFSDDDDGAVVVAAAWLHDIGYAPALAETGFHPLDGARHLRGLGFCDRVVCLVAHHTLAIVEARLRGVGDVLAREFPREDSLAADALLYCDLTTGPTGRPVTVRERLAEVRERYGPGHVVSAFIDEAEHDMLAAVARVETDLRRAPSSQTDTTGPP